MTTDGLPTDAGLNRENETSSPEAQIVGDTVSTRPVEIDR